jgi:hypothetical protein
MNMTPLQNHPQQHQCEAENLKFRIPRGGERFRNLRARGSQVGPQKCGFTAKRNGGGVRRARSTARSGALKETAGSSRGAFVEDTGPAEAGPMC